MIRVVIVIAIGFAIGLAPMWLPHFGVDFASWLQERFSFTSSHAERAAFSLFGFLTLVYFWVILTFSRD